MARIVALSFALALASCGGSSSTAGSGEGSGGTGGGETAVATLAWADMNAEQRGAFMADVVMPEMQAMFQEHDGARFAEFTCATCHGANAAEVGFHMPNGMSPLDQNAIPAMFASSDPMHVFMTQRVWPRMGELLGETLYNPETHEGFRCVNCHADGTPAAASAPAVVRPERVAAN